MNLLRQPEKHEWSRTGIYLTGFGPCEAVLHPLCDLPKVAGEDKYVLPVPGHQLNTARIRKSDAVPKLGHFPECCAVEYRVQHDRRSF
jgi:hypothetical protein